MSYRAFIVCEDHTHDQYVVRPVVKAMLSFLGKPKAVVQVVTSPHLTGISTVEDQFRSIVERYAPISDLIIFALDRDALDGMNGRGDRKARFDYLLSTLPPDQAVKTEVILAVEELEVWALWGSRGGISSNWAVVRAERDSKEKYFDPLVSPSDLKQPGMGRARLIEKSLEAGWGSISQGCAELKALENSIALTI